MSAEELKLLVVKRGLIKASVTRIGTFVDKFDASDNINQLKTRLPNLQGAFREFDVVQTQIELQDGSAKQTKERDDFETNYYNLESTILTLIDQSSASVSVINAGPSTSAGASGQARTISNVRLPRLDLPSFSGNYLEWTAFSDTFQALIHCSSLYTNIEKFHYLKSCLRGDAHRTIESISVSEANYNSAWEILKKRYEHKRLIVQEHVLAILNTPNLIKNSHSSTRRLVDDVMINLEALKTLKQSVDKWDALLIPIIVSKFDFMAKKDWESTLNSDIPSVEDLLSFLEKKCILLESLAASDSRPNSIQIKKTRGPIIANNSFNKGCNASISSKIQCYMCKKSHAIYHCPDFLNLTLAERINTVRSLKLCANCLKVNHQVDNCKYNPCRRCDQKHNSLLHEPIDTESSINNSNVGSVVTYVKGFDKPVQILLSTAQIMIKKANGQWLRCRALLDVGSQINFMTKSTCENLGLPLTSVNWPITGINDAKGSAQQLVKIHFKSIHDNFNYRIDCLVLPKITENLPVVSLDKNCVQIPYKLALADPLFYDSSTIDVLLGADIFWKILGTGQIKATRHIPHLQETCLGWVVGGNIANLRGNKPFLVSAVCNLSLNALNKQMQKFWEIDECLSAHPCNYTQDEIQCENLFVDTFKRRTDGRFVVNLPFKINPSNIGFTKEIAMKRFLALENKFKRDLELKTNYTQFIDEYLKLGHMEPVLQANLIDSNAFYLPHHAVIKESSKTTKLRVVFDASALSSTGVSLNDTLMVGPKLQDDLFSIILRFRTYKFVLTADISKMYSQILIAPEDRKYQRILWRNNSDEPVNVFQLNTVTYGTACAPFLAVRCLQELAIQEKDKYKHAYPIVMRDFYMDDVLTGANSLTKAIKIRDELISLLDSGGFDLCKWSSNDQALLPRIINENLKDKDTNMINFDKDGDTKTLGLFWNCKDDFLKYRVVIDSITIGHFTKRKILSSIARIFDPLNLLGPVIILAKLIMQKLWELQLGWDEELPADLDKSWSQLIRQLDQLNFIKFPRRVINIYPYTKLELDGFCDASQRAYGACIYMRAVGPSGECSVELMCAKSRVAPLKTISVPRLELCGALLLAKLMTNVKEHLNVPIDDIFFWTDSTIVLAWLAASSSNFKTFVANRISEIQTLTEIQSWNHVGTDDNPADIISRGMLPNELFNCGKWFHGPAWLQLTAENWPQTRNASKLLEVPEVRKIALVAIAYSDVPWINKFSSLNKLKRVTAYCFRFIYNCRNKISKRIEDFSVTELQSAMNVILRLIQQLEFGDDLISLKSNRELNHKSKLKLLHPFVDTAGLIRVGGRLQNSELSHDQKLPIVLPKHYITELIIKLEHQNHLHAGPLATLAAIRQKYWPLAGRNQVKKVIRMCSLCFRAKPTGVDPLMGNLPSDRFAATRPFINCGVDYAGPILIKEGKTRSKRTSKAYICLFVCFATKAIHLELVGDLTTLNFLGALKRFISRRGMVLNIHSDNATYFVGAQRELNNIFKSQEFNELVMTYLTNNNIKWHFIPPRAPHFGGIWEAGVKSAKFHLKRVLGNTLLTFEEMDTLLTCIEACLNSRPLCPLSSDPGDLNALTPGHFLIGAPLTATPEPSLMNLSENRLSRWQYVEQRRQHFWSRWNKEYLSELHQIGKWQGNKEDPIQLGRLVLLKESTPPLTWKLGRIIELHPGSDGVTRVITVKLSHGVAKRAVRNVCVLPVE